MARARTAHEAGYQEERELSRLHLAEILAALDRAEEAANLHAEATPALPKLFGAASEQVADAIRIGGRIAPGTA